MFEIDLDSDHEHFEIEAVLDGETFRLAFRWDERTDGWYLSLSDPDGVAVASGRRLTVENFLFLHLAGRDRPGGQLMAIDTEGNDADPGRYDLGTRVKLIYFEVADIQAALAEEEEA